MLTISQFLGWGKGNVAQNKDNFYREYGRETLLHEARAVEVISFLRANRRMSTFRSTLKELGFVFLNTNGKRKVQRIQSRYNGWISWSIFEVRYASACCCIWNIQKVLFTLLQTWRMLLFLGRSWDAILKMTDIKLELLTDINMFQFIEKGMRGGISYLANWYARVNNKHMNSHNAEESS